VFAGNGDKATRRKVHVEKNDWFIADAGRVVVVGLCDCRVSEREVWSLCFENGRTATAAQGLRKTNQDASFQEMSSIRTLRILPLFAVLTLLCAVFRARILSLSPSSADLRATS